MITGMRKFRPSRYRVSVNIHPLVKLFCNGRVVSLEPAEHFFAGLCPSEIPLSRLISRSNDVRGVPY